MLQVHTQSTVHYCVYTQCNITFLKEGLPPFHFGLAPFLLGLPNVLYATKTEDPVLFPLVFCQQIEDLHTIFRTILCTSVFI